MHEPGEPPLVIIVGGDGLALQVCEELMQFGEQEVVIIWPVCEPTFVARLESCGARLVQSKPNDEGTLRAAGVARASSIMMLTDDDHLNLETALKARDLSPAIRLVLRQFNRTLGQKIEAKLPNCSVISLAAQSAATYATVAVDRECYYGVQFPDFTGPLFGFALRPVGGAVASGMTIVEAEAALGERILAVGADLADDRTRRLRDGDELATFGLVRPGDVRGRPSRAARGPAEPALAVVRRLTRAIVRSDPLVRRVAIASFAIFLCATIYFSRTLDIDPVTSAYFVMATMTTTGYGDIVPHSSDHAEQVASMVTMAAGVVSTAIFVAVLTTRFTKVQWTLQQGLRRIARRDHIVVCGAGNVGTRVIDFLVALGRQVVVIEEKPRSTIVERSRDHEFDLLTADATADATLDLCNLAEADALIALTESDTMNLEVALGATQINPALLVVMRTREQTFARSIAIHFDLRRTFGTAGLAAPVFAGLSRSPGVRGFVTIVGREFGVSEISPGTPFAKDAPGRIPLVVWRDGAGVLVHDFDEIGPDDRALMLYPAYLLRRRPRVERPEERPRTHAGMRLDDRPASEA